MGCLSQRSSVRPHYDHTRQRGQWSWSTCEVRKYGLHSFVCTSCWGPYGRHDLKRKGMTRPAVGLYTSGGRHLELWAPWHNQNWRASRARFENQVPSFGLCLLLRLSLVNRGGYRNSSRGGGGQGPLTCKNPHCGGLDPWILQGGSGPPKSRSVGIFKLTSTNKQNLKLRLAYA